MTTNPIVQGVSDHSYNTNSTVPTTTQTSAPTTVTNVGTAQKVVNGVTYNYVNGSWVPATTPKTTTTPTTTPKTNTGSAQVVAGTAGPGQINVADYAGQIATDPSKAFTLDNPKTKNVNESEMLSTRVPTMTGTEAGTNINPNAAKYQSTPDQFNGTAQTVQNTAQADQVAPKTAETYTADQAAGKVAQQDMTAAQGQVDPRAQVTAPQIDIKGTATGINEDNSINYTGQALNDYASQDLNTVDQKATVKGQLDILQSEFTGPNGEPVIPAWAAGTARAVSRIAAFKGMTGTAAVDAMSQALHESSISVAQQDAQFFQTLTLQNLNNKQAMTINKANTLAKMDEVNADNRMAAAIQNSKNFMDMDLANLNNEQQARVINTQDRVQSILEDSKAVNAQRLFTATSQNDMAKFYDELGSQISQFNASQNNSMAQFNTGEVNSMEKFNSELESQRQQFYQNMQYNIDTSNAKWRQTVTLQNNQNKFDAAATDVKNMVGMSVEQLNQLWDRSDSLLDMIWKTSENEKDRQSKIALTKLQGQIQSDQADSAGLGTLFGSVLGKVAGSDQFLNFLFK